MRISAQNNINFTSRSAQYKKADKICRLVNNTYPTYSPSKTMLKSIFKKDYDLYKYANSLQEIIKEKIRLPLQYPKDLNLKYVKNGIEYFLTSCDLVDNTLTEIY